MPFLFPSKFRNALNSIHATSQVKDTFSAPTTGVQATYPPSTELWEGKEGRLGRDWGGGVGERQDHLAPVTNEMGILRKAEEPVCWGPGL